LIFLLEFIVLRHQLTVLRQTGTRRPCCRPSEPREISVAQCISQTFVQFRLMNLDDVLIGVPSRQGS
jgi:hypothetical protein